MHGYVTKSHTHSSLATTTTTTIKTTTTIAVTLFALFLSPAAPSNLAAEPFRQAVLILPFREAVLI
jgi:hypothetical protein